MKKITYRYKTEDTEITWEISYWRDWAFLTCNHEGQFKYIPFPEKIIDRLFNQDDKKKKVMKKVIDDIINSGESPPSRQLPMKCPDCDGVLFCDLYPDRILYLCGTYNCGFNKSFKHSDLLDKDPETEV